MTLLLVKALISAFFVCVGIICVFFFLLSWMLGKL